MDSFGKSLGAFFEERMANPLISSFSVAWGLYNYKVLVILFSKNTVTETFSLINQRFPDWISVFVHGFFFPALFSAIYLFVLPYPTQRVYKWVREKQKDLDDIRDEYESHKRLTKEQSQELRRSIREQQDLIEDLQKTNRLLAEDLKELQKAEAQAQTNMRDAQAARADAERRLEDMKLFGMPFQNASPLEESRNLKDSNDKDDAVSSTIDAQRNNEMTMLGLIAARDRVLPSQIRDKIDIDRVTFDFLLQDLIDRRLVVILGKGAAGSFYGITQEGRRELLRRTQNFAESETNEERSESKE